MSTDVRNVARLVGAGYRLPMGETRSFVTVGLAGATAQSATAAVRERAAAAAAAAAARAAAACELAGAVAAFALSGEGTVSAEALMRVQSACEAEATRGDEVMALLDAARGRIALRSRTGAPTPREIAALACRSRSAVLLSLGARPSRAEAIAYLRAAPDALPGLFDPPSNRAERMPVADPQRGQEGAVEGRDGSEPVLVDSEGQNRLQGDEGWVDL